MRWTALRTMVFQRRWSVLYRLMLLGTPLRSRIEYSRPIVLGCLYFRLNELNRRSLTVDNLTVFVETPRFPFDRFMLKLEGNGYEATQDIARGFVHQLRTGSYTRTYKTLGQIDELGYGVRWNFVGKADDGTRRVSSFDLFDLRGDMLYRGHPDRLMAEFVNVRKLSKKEKLRYWESTINQNMEAFGEYGFDKDLFQRVTGYDYPDVVLKPGPPDFESMGLSPDFSKFDEVFIAKNIYPGRGFGDISNAKIKIKMSGNYREDFRRATELAGIDPGDIPAGKVAPEGWVWHHLDDYNPIDNTCTMQLVRKELHAKVVKGPESFGVLNQGTEHVGACAIWRRFHGVMGYYY